MERKCTWMTSLTAMGIAVMMFGCSKTATEPEVKGPKETVVLNLVDVSNNTVGAVFIDNMDGRAQARIRMNNGSYSAGTDMKANITLSDGSTTTVYANCKDVSGKDGQCSTFPITVLSDNSDALYQKVITTNGLVFNVMDANNHVVARSARHTIVIDN